MASKNSVKSDIKDGYYHIYNRGVGKMTIFKNEADYGVFLSYLKEYLSPPLNKKDRIYVIHMQDRVFNGVARPPKNFSERIELTCYCLMPNHFHFIIKQLQNGAMRDFVHSILLRYSMYFNKKYNRVGPLFQGRFKAVFIENETYLLHLSRYIHLNPREYTNKLLETKSSYADFLGLKNTPWVNPEIVLSFFNKNVSLEFNKTNNYKKFVEDERNNTEILRDVVLE